jgi:hypothetical protein
MDMRHENVIAARGVPSPNLLKVFESLEAGQLAPLVALAAKIERGDADCTEEETDKLYDALGLLLDHVRDLANMCRRREEALAQHGIAFGSAVA